MNSIDTILGSKPTPKPSDAEPLVPNYKEKVNEELIYINEPTEQLSLTENNPEVPSYTEKLKDIPPTYNPINTIFVDDIYVEIKPTKLKYFRNGQAGVYDLLKVLPLAEFLNLKKGQFDKNRDGDQMLFDFLVAVINDPEFVHDHYDNFDADTIERILEIFGRLNHIEEKKEAARKNLATQGTA